MEDSPQEPEQTGRAKLLGLVLGIDTCGPMGSVALARVGKGSVEILGQKELDGRNCSALLISAVSELLIQSNAEIRMVQAIVIVNGPGSFTGVRVGVSATKGLAEGRPMGVVAVSRLAVLAAKAGAESAALDAHRGEVFLRVAGSGHRGSELLVGKDELGALELGLGRIAVCDEAAAATLQAALPAAELVRTGAPTAADAIELGAEIEAMNHFVDLVLLDGHYLRRSDAEIFGEPGARAKQI